MSDQTHCTFIRLIDQLRAEAESEGDSKFAGALTQCMLEVSGGNVACPMGDLILEDTLYSGKPPGAVFSSPPASSSRTIGDHRPPKTNALKRGDIFDTLRNLLKQEAAQKQDARYLEALQACERITNESSDSDCPIRRLLEEREDASKRSGE